MAKSKIERIAGIEEEIRQLENRWRELIQAQERKDRTKRLCRRMGLFESLLPATIPLTEEQFKTFLEQTATSEQGRRLLAELTAQNAAQDAGGTCGAEGREDGNADGRAAQGRTYISHKCGMCGLADGVLCLTAQKKTAGAARRKEHNVWPSTIVISKSYPAARASQLLSPLTGAAEPSPTNMTA